MFVFALKERRQLREARASVLSSVSLSFSLVHFSTCFLFSTCKDLAYWCPVVLVRVSCPEDTFPGLSVNLCPIS